MIKIINVVGARPNFIKIAPLQKEFVRDKRFRPLLVHTGQHYDDSLSKVFFKELEISEPDIHLKVGSGTHASQTAKIMLRFERILEKEKPHLVLVVGDVNSTLACSLVAAKMGIPIAHVEAGLRSFDRTMPEEINRLITDHLSEYLFCPTKTAVVNLAKEGITRGVFKVGDVMYDLFPHHLTLAQKRSKILADLNLKPKEYLLVTVHRAENTDQPLRLQSIVETLGSVKEKVIFPVHPRTRKVLAKMLPTLIVGSNIQLIDPVGYFDMLILEKNARKILTDSGGVQKEAFFLRVPCITLRERTEWLETLDQGWNTLVGAKKEKILRAVKKSFPLGKRLNVFGDGKSVKKIIEILNRRQWQK